MNIRHTLLALCAVAALTAAADQADTARLNEIGAEQLRISNETRDLVETLEHELQSEKYDTPEMKKQREKIAELKEQVRLAEKELRRQFEQLPEVQERVKIKEANLARLRELHEERTALRKRAAEQKSAKPVAAAPATEEKPADARE